MKKIILIVEDEKSLSGALSSKLADLGAEILIESDVKSAQISIASHKPNLVVLDIILPGGENGFDLLEEMKRQPETSNIPVIVLTNLDSEEEVSKKIGANEYFVKSDTSLEKVKEKVIEYLK